MVRGKGLTGTHPMEDEGMKRFQLIGGVIIMIGMSVLMSLYINYERMQITDKEYIVIEQEEDVPLDGELPTEAMSLEELQTYLNERLALVPENVMNALIADGWQIILTSENLSERYFQGILSTVNAVTDSTIKTIWINETERAITKSAIHEVGHYLDFKFGIINTSPEFVSIYEAEKRSFKVVDGSAGYARTSSQEYFAEAFQQCILHPENVQTNAPMTYAFIMNLVSQL